MANVARFTERLRSLTDVVEVHDDFKWAVTAHEWTTLVADTTPTVTVGDAANGVVALFTDTTDNNEVALRTTAELFLYGTNRSIYANGRIQYAENDTNRANVMFGFMSALAANSITDNGGAIRASGSIAAIYKLDGGTVWRCHTANNSVATDTVSTTTAGGASYQELEIIVNDWDGVSQQVSFKVDGTYLKDTNGNIIRHVVAVASATEMNFGIYCKTGGGAGGETLRADWLYAAQTRV